MDTQPTTAAPSFPRPPRAVTVAVRRRAWAEPHVRFWWLGALALLIVAGYFLGSRYANWHEGVRLLSLGVPAQAKILIANSTTSPGQSQPGDSWVRIEYEYNGRTYHPEVTVLDGRKTDDPVTVGGMIPIRVDPANPENWTPRLTPAPLVQDLIGGFLVLGAAILVLLVSWWQRSRVLRTWREGGVIPALVLGARHTALAPRAWSVRCTPLDESDKRVFNVFVPPRSDVSPGARTSILLRPTGGRAIAYVALNPDA